MQQKLIDYLKTKNFTKEELQEVQTILDEDYTVGFNVSSVRQFNPFYSVDEAICILDKLDDEYVWESASERLSELHNEADIPESLTPAVLSIFQYTYGRELGDLLFDMCGECIIDDLNNSYIIFDLYTFYTHGAEPTNTLLDFISKKIGYYFKPSYYKPSDLCKYIISTNEVYPDIFFDQLAKFWSTLNFDSITITKAINELQSVRCA